MTKTEIEMFDALKELLENKNETIKELEEEIKRLKKVEETTGNKLLKDNEKRYKGIAYIKESEEINKEELLKILD